MCSLFLREEVYVVVVEIGTYIIYVLHNTRIILYVLNYIAIYLLHIALCLLYIAVVRIYALCYDPAYSFKSNRIEYEVYI